jgi:hypothetical protein
MFIVEPFDPALTMFFKRLSEAKASRAILPALSRA